LQEPRRSIKRLPGLGLRLDRLFGAGRVAPGVGDMALAAVGPLSVARAAIVARARLVVLDLTEADAVRKRVVGQCNESLAWSRESIGSVAAIIRTHWRRPRTIWIAVVAGAAPPIISARPRLRFRSDNSAGRGANCCVSDRAGSAA
jgi:hypothetical protein